MSKWIWVTLLSLLGSLEFWFVEVIDLSPELSCLVSNSLAYRTILWTMDLTMSTSSWETWYNVMDFHVDLVTIKSVVITTCDLGGSFNMLREALRGHTQCREEETMSLNYGFLCYSKSVRYGVLVLFWSTEIRNTKKVRYSKTKKV